MTTLTLSDTSTAEVAADAIVVGITSGERGVELGAGTEAIDAALGGKLAQVLGQLGATGKAGEVTKLATLGATAAPIVAAVGLGKREKAADPDTLRQAAAVAVRALAGSSKVAVALGDLVPAVAEGALLGAYEFSAYKSVQPDGYKGPVRSVVLVGASGSGAKAVLKRANALVGAVSQARDWVNTPPNLLRPPGFADEARALAEKAGLAVEVLDEKALRKGGYGGILAVGTGSSAAPRLVRIAYTTAGAKKTVALVGKGITFDSGGISIKPAPHMDLMKSDMAGAAAVIATMLAVAALKPKVNVIAYAPMAENMPSGTAYRPGDVVTMYGGKSVEVLNTDAEGRMILGDALARAVEDAPDYLIDTATLTGGQVVALGARVAGVMGSPEFTERVCAAGDSVGEPMWAMPIPDEVRSGMDSAIADVTQINAGFDRSAHMLQGGAFLREFVGDVPWAHIDIAGPSYNSATAYGYIPKGGTGMPTRALVALIEDIAANG